MTEERGKNEGLDSRWPTTGGTLVKVALAMACKFGSNASSSPLDLAFFGTQRQLFRATTIDSRPSDFVNSSKTIVAQITNYTFMHHSLKIS